MGTLGTAYDVNTKVVIKANRSDGKVIGIYLGYNSLTPSYEVEYVTNSTNEITSRYFVADELEPYEVQDESE